MFDPNNSGNRVDALFQPFLEQWTNYVRYADETTKMMLGGFDCNADSSAWRQQWFDALSRETDVYLRSPLFLGMMKAHIDSVIQAKRKADLSQHELDSLAARLSDVEQAVQSQLEQLERRVEAIGNRFGHPSSARCSEQIRSAVWAPGTTTDGTIGATPHEVVYQEGTLKLLRYGRRSVKFAEPVLISYALVNRPYILDWPDDRSVVRRLLERGLDVYLIDWGVPTDADHTLTLEDYVCRLLKNAADFVCEHAGSPTLNLLGYCMGGTMSTMFTALFPEQVRNLILLATPIDFADDAGLLNLWAREEYFDVDGLIDTYGNCPGDFLRYCFQLMKPVQNFAEKYVALCENLDDNAFLDNFLAVERWANDSIPVAGETFREYVKMLYQQNRLVKDEMSLGGAPVKLDAITCPLLLLIAEHDHLVPPRSTLAVERAVQSRDVMTLSINAGHVGLAVGSQSHSQLWPEAANWIAEHSSRRTWANWIAEHSTKRT